MIPPDAQNAHCEASQGMTMSIKSKLYAGFGILVLIGVALSVYAVTQFNSIKANVATLNTLANARSRMSRPPA